MPEELNQAMLNILSNWVDEQTHRNDRLTAKDISKEYHIGESLVYKMFKNPDLPVQSYTRPAFILRKEWEKFFEKRHDELCS